MDRQMIDRYRYGMVWYRYKDRDRDWEGERKTPKKYLHKQHPD